MPDDLPEVQRLRAHAAHLHEIARVEGRTAATRRKTYVLVGAYQTAAGALETAARQLEKEATGDTDV